MGIVNKFLLKNYPSDPEGLLMATIDIMDTDVIQRVAKRLESLNLNFDELYP